MATIVADFGDYSRLVWTRRKLECRCGHRRFRRRC